MVERLTMSSHPVDGGSMDVHPHGDYVLYSDFAELEAENARLTKALDRAADRMHKAEALSRTGGRMNVDAMIKHHQAVTEVITHAMSDYASAATGTSWNKACFAFEADAILCALSRAGFRIIGPDEVDQVTIRAADLAVWKALSGTPAYAEPQAIAQRAIRALASGESR